MHCNTNHIHIPATIASATPAPSPASSVLEVLSLPSGPLREADRDSKAKNRVATFGTEKKSKEVRPRYIPA
jgi:hypothetical protein